MDFRSWTSFCFPTIQRWSTARGKEAWLKIYQELFRWYNLINCDSLNFQEFDVDAPEIEETGRVEVQLGQAGPARVPLVDPRTIDPQRDTNTSRSNIREEQAARFPVFEREQVRDVDREHVRRVGEASNVGSVG